MNPRLQRRIQRYGWDLAAHAYEPLWQAHLAPIQQELVACAANVCFDRMDAEDLRLPCGAFDVVLCALGLMYVPNPARAVLEMRRVLRPGGRVVLAVWGARARCGWAPVFPIVDAEVASEVCPLFFGLGEGDALGLLCAHCGFAVSTQRRLTTVLEYSTAEEACAAAFVGGPVALAWSRFDAKVRARVEGRYLGAIVRWRSEQGYRIPAEFVLVAASA
jgi:SAM-dependent methyltransferase